MKSQFTVLYFEGFKVGNSVFIYYSVYFEPALQQSIVSSFKFAHHL